MNWKKIHDQIISKAKDRILEGYSEKHHIIPKSLGGTNDDNNLVRLTAKEHFIIHKLLCLIYPNESKLHWAAFRMANGKGNKLQDRNYRVGAREYQRLNESLIVSDGTRKKLSKSLKGNQSRLGAKLSKETKEKIRLAKLGKPGPMKSKNHTKEAKQKMSKSAKLRKNTPHTEETKQKMSDTWVRLKSKGWTSPLTGIPRDEETKRKISNSKKGQKRGKFSNEWLDNLSKSLKGKSKGKIWINNGERNTMINPDDGIPEGWAQGMFKKPKNNNQN